MPTYEYECLSCHHAFEASQKITDTPLSKCPKCGKKIKKLVSIGGGIIFKGKGFYSTDYRKSKPVTPAACPKTSEACKSCPHNG